MAARTYKRKKKKVFSTRTKSVVKNNWVFDHGRISKIGIATIVFKNKSRGAKFISKQVSIDRWGPLQFVYYTPGGQMKMFEVKRTAKILDSFRKYKNRLT